jgi:hypothetical protein
MPDEIAANAVLDRPDAINSCGCAVKSGDFKKHGGDIEIGKKHGPEEDVFYQGRGQTQGAFDQL